MNCILHASPFRSGSLCAPRHIGRESGFLNRFVRWGLFLVSLLMLNAPVFGESGVTLEWDANVEPDVVGYKLHYGTASGVYFTSVDAGNATTAEVPGLIANFTYYFAVTAYNTEGLESPPSNEVVFTMPMPSNFSFEYTPRTQVPANSTGEIDFKLMAPVAANGRFSFKVTGSPRSAVAIYASCDLLSWDLLGVVTNPTGGFVATDLDTSQFGCRYYRVAQVDVPTTGIGD